MLALAFLIVAVGNSRNDWEVVCAAAVAVSWLPVSYITRSFKRTLADLKSMWPLSDKNWSCDLVRGPLLCVSLGLCGQWVLFSCCAATLVVTTATTEHLALTVLDEVKKTPAAADWVADNGKLVTFVGIAASSRLDMIVVLKLKLCGKVWCEMPMEDKHFHFVRHSGMYHYLIEDMPHALVGIASWRVGCDDDLHFGVDARTFAICSAGLSACSIVFGLVNKAVQMCIASGRDRGSLLPLLLGSGLSDFTASGSQIGAWPKRQWPQTERGEGCSMELRWTSHRRASRSQSPRRSADTRHTTARPDENLRLTGRYQWSRSRSPHRGVVR